MKWDNMTDDDQQREFQTVLRYLKALADESRLRILGILASGERSVEDLAAMLKLRAPTVSHHLALLREVELVEARADGTTRYYRLRPQGLSAINRAFSAPEQLAVFARDEDANAWERKVLRDFFEGERLKEIPASRKKREVILRWLAERFEARRRYSEAEVNDLLQQYHPDSATLRRELIGLGLLARENGFYWRIMAD
jgi:DNA-binding HxlR family transcriptional regulator